MGNWHHKEELKQAECSGAIGQPLHPAVTPPLPLALVPVIGQLVKYYALADHQHTHGNLPGGTLHALVNQFSAGFVPPFGNAAAFYVLSVANNVPDWREISEMGTGDVVGPDVSVDGDLAVFDGITGKVIRDSGIQVSDLLTAANHETLLQLIHFIDEGPARGFASGAYEEQLPSGNPFPTSATWYTDATKAKKIVSQVVTYNPNMTVATETWTVYASDGVTPAEVVMDNIAYAGIVETSRTRVIT